MKKDVVNKLNFHLGFIKIATGNYHGKVCLRKWYQLFLFLWQRGNARCGAGPYAGKSVQCHSFGNDPGAGMILFPREFLTSQTGPFTCQ